MRSVVKGAASGAKKDVKGRKMLREGGTSIFSIFNKENKHRIERKEEENMDGDCHGLQKSIIK